MPFCQSLDEKVLLLESNIDISFERLVSINGYLRLQIGHVMWRHVADSRGLEIKLVIR